MDAPADGEFAHELKFAITPDQVPDVLVWARSNLAADPHGSGKAGDSYRISTLYFDTPDLAVYHARGSFARSKYRVRRYGSGDTVFLERKLKVGDRVAKRRSAFPLTNVRSADPETVWFFDRIALRNLRPVCQIAYTRVARIGKVHGNVVRFTIDRDLEAIRTTVLDFNSRPGEPLSEQRCIVELKFRHEMPPLFVRFIEDYGLQPQGCSKYKLALPALGVMQPAEEPIDVAC